MKSVFAHAAASFALLFSLAAWGGPQLLLPYDGAVAKSERRSFHSEGFRVKFNLDELRKVKHGEEVDLALPNGKTHTVVFDLLQSQGDGVVSWVGHLKGSRDKLRVIITTGPSGSFGRIATPDGDFALIPGEGYDWLIDMVAEQPHLPMIDLKKDTRTPPAMPKSMQMQPMHAPEFLQPVPGLNTVPVSKATPPQVVVDIMFVYTPTYALNLGGSLSTRLNFLVTSANTMFADSEVGITLRLVHSVSVNYTDLNDGGDALDEITPVDLDGGGPMPAGGQGVFANIESLRTTYGADMVAFLRNGSDFGGSGIAWIANTAMGPGFAPYMYSVTTGCVRGCEWVFVHELGHNMGNAHDRATTSWQQGGTPTPTPGSYPYSFGYAQCQGNVLSCNPTVPGGCASQPECSTPRAGTNNISDIMAYFHGTTTRNFKFSNPAMTCTGALGIGQACGINEALSNSANAALSMNNNRVALSALKATTVASASATTVVTSSQNPSTAGQLVTFTATVTGASGVPTGTVNFRANGSTIGSCSAQPMAGGVATCATSTLVAGTHSITALYSGNMTYSANTSTALSQGVIFVKMGASTALSTSRNPSHSGQRVTFTAIVSGGGGPATGTFDFRDGATSIAGCSAVAILDGTARCTTAALSVGSHAITAVYSGDATYLTATTSAVSQGVTSSTNVALASVGAVATASSTYGPSSPASAAINGDRAGAAWGSGGGWEDGTDGMFPDWLQIAFNGTKVVSQVTVYTLRNDIGNAAEPTDTETFSAYGITAFTVEGWTGSAWTTLATVTGNNMLKRTIDFTPFTTDRIRINVTNGLYFKSRIVEVEVWGTASSTSLPTNVALASAGAVATASSTYGGTTPVAAVNDNLRTGATWGSGGGWEDATYNAYPDWVEIAFNGNKVIDRVVVYTLRDDIGNTSEPTDSTTFTYYGLTHFTVEGWNGSSWAVLGTVASNNLVKRTVTFAPFTTDRIRINVTGALYFKSRIVEIEAWGLASSAPAASNVALASTGAVASASSTYGPSAPVASVIDNQRTGATWGSGGGWEDATYNAYPDWVQVVFNGAKTIERVVVYTLRDDIGNTAEPGDATTFSAYGITSFTVEGWTGSAWTVLGTVTGNNLVKRTVTFAPFTTDRIRINVNAALYFKSRIVEIEAWGVASSTPIASNVALASAGGVASASSVYGPTAPVASVNDNQRTGATWGSGGGWEDATYNAYPDWVQIVFSGSKTIDRVVVYTLRDDIGNTAEPTDATTFTAYGVTGFTVEGWNGSAWVNLGTVTGNNLVKRTVNFAAFATDRIRVNVTGALYFKSRIVEIEAWGT